MSQALLVTIARFVNRDFRAPIMLSGKLCLSNLYCIICKLLFFLLFSPSGVVRLFLLDAVQPDSTLRGGVLFDHHNYGHVYSAAMG